jgi:site-specific DNA-methyltransferase (adenine-specific)
MSEMHLLQGDCLDILPTLPDGCADAIITDLPYGTTACSWDVVIPFAPMWEQVKRVLSDRGAFVTTASQPFTSVLVASNLEWFKYEWIWNKSRPSGHVMAKNKPLKTHENVVVFSPGATVHEGQSERRMTYNPQDLVYAPTRSYRPNRRIRSQASMAARPSNVDEWIQEYTNYPKSLLDIPNPNNHNDGHPTQKPVALYEYLIKTYTNPGDTVLDFCMGSGTTGVAAVKTGRNFIGIEKEAPYFQTSERRITDAQMQQVMPL